MMAEEIFVATLLVVLAVGFTAGAYYFRRFAKQWNKARRYLGK